MFQQFAIFGLGTPELAMILVAILLLFGGKKLPELSRSIAESVKEIKKGAASTKDAKQSSESNAKLSTGQAAVSVKSK